MDNTDFRQVILDQKNGIDKNLWTGKMLDYLYMVKENPDIAIFAPGRIYNMIMSKGTEKVDESYKIRGYEDLVKYSFFNDRIYGCYNAIHDIMKFLKASSRRTETGKRILILVGPVSSGKSTIATLFKRGLEEYNLQKFAVKGCPLHEEPLHLIPIKDRPYWEEVLGVKIEGHLCPVCLQHMEENNVAWEDMMVTEIKFSEQKRMGVGTFSPSDPKAQDVSELIGRVNLAKISRYGETDPRAYQFDGELDIANGGMLELIELLKVDTKLLYVFITVAQEQVVKSPGFPQIYIDELLLAHTNLTEFDSFKSDKKNEALHDRIYPIMVPWNTVVNDEIKIYEKMIRESDFRNIHIAPGTLKIAAQFAVLTRLAQSTKIPSLLDKMKLYNGEITEEVRKQDIDIKSLREEGKEKGEGMFGISPRFIINALNVALGMKEDKMCINPIDIIRALRENFDHHMGITNEEKSKYLDLLIGEKDSVRFEFNQFALKEVNMAFLVAYEEQAQSLFDNYVINAQAFCKNERVFDSILQEYSDPDEKLMRSIEELVGVPVNSKKEFRNNLFVYKATLLEQGKPFTFRDYTPLKDAIEKKLVSDLKNIVSLTIADKTITNEKVKKRRKDAIDNLIEKGYCKLCAENLLAFVGESIRKGT